MQDLQAPDDPEGAGGVYEMEEGARGVPARARQAGGILRADARRAIGGGAQGGFGIAMQG